MITLRAAVRHDRSEAPAVAPARPEPRPKLRVVEPSPARGRAGQDADKRSAGGVVGTLLVVLLFVCVFGVVVFQVFLVQTQSHLDQLDHDIAKQEDRAKDLRLQTTDLEAPDRIVKDAEGRLGMISPGGVVWLQPNAGDDAKAAFDPTKEAPPASAPPTTVPGAGAGPATSGSGTATGAGTGKNGATTPTTAWTPPTTAWTPPTTAWTPPTTAWTPPKTKTTPSTTPVTTATRSTTPTSAPKTSTTVARPTTTTRTR